MVAAYSNKDEKHFASIDKLITENKLGGLIFFRGGPVKQAKLTNRFQKISKIPLFIGIDAEWGLSMRLDSTYRHPYNMTLGAIKNLELIEKVGKQMGKQSKRLGIHFNFSPVLDINTNPQSPIIGNRSFGEDKNNVTNKAIALMNGLRSEGIFSTGKHFPGHRPARSTVRLGRTRHLQGAAAARAGHRAVGIESLLTAVVADGSIGGRHRSNMELVAQGGANVVSALFGGIPATGAIARTATNIKNGGRTPMAGMVHAVVLLLILLVAGQWAALIPMACLAGILVVVAWNMAEVHSFIAVFRTSRYDMAVLLVTFLLTAFVDLVVASEIGLVLASFLFMKRMSDSTRLSELGAPDAAGEKLFEAEFGKVPAHAVMYEINGPLFFGAAQTFTETIRKVGDQHRVLILRMRHVTFIDATELHRLADIIETMERRHVHVLLTDVLPDVRNSLRDAGLLTEGRLCPDVRSAMALAGAQRNS